MQINVSAREQQKLLPQQMQADNPRIKADANTGGCKYSKM